MNTEEDKVDELWEKHCIASDGNNPDRMFYEGFCDAIQDRDWETVILNVMFVT